jgi:hypothetical protein
MNKYRRSSTNKLPNTNCKTSTEKTKLTGLANNFKLKTKNFKDKLEKINSMITSISN